MDFLRSVRKERDHGVKKVEEEEIGETTTQFVVAHFPDRYIALK